MKVRCIKVLNHQGEEVAHSSLVKLGGIYDVVSIYLAPILKLAIITEEGAKLGPRILPLKQFELVDGTIPENCEVSMTSPDIMTIELKAFMPINFWENFFDGEAKERKIYQEELAKIIQKEVIPLENGEVQL